MIGAEGLRRPYPDTRCDGSNSCVKLNRANPCTSHSVRGQGSYRQTYNDFVFHRKASRRTSWKISALCWYIFHCLSISIQSLNSPPQQTQLRTMNPASNRHDSRCSPIVITPFSFLYSVWFLSINTRSQLFFSQLSFLKKISFETCNHLNKTTKARIFLLNQCYRRYLSLLIFQALKLIDRNKAISCLF